MLEHELLRLLESVRTGAVPTGDALRLLASGPFRTSELGFAELDHHRGLRLGLGEVVYGESKTSEQILAIVAELEKGGGPVLTTRLDAAKSAELEQRFPAGRSNRAARTFLLNAPPLRGSAESDPHVAIVAAGTSDLPVAEEAGAVCSAMGIPVASYCDVGVAGIHRLLSKVNRLRTATALVVVAGMEGALPSAVAGLVGRPVFAVPTSVGYGANLGGLAALLGMLNSCAPGVTVVNIDNGFSAGFAAAQVVRAVLDGGRAPAAGRASP